MKRSVFGVCVVAACLLRIATAGSPIADAATRHRTSGSSPATDPRIAGRHRASDSPRTRPRHMTLAPPSILTTHAPPPPPLPFSTRAPPPEVLAQRACNALLATLSSDPATLNSIQDPFVRSFVSLMRVTRPVARAVIRPPVLERWLANAYALCSATPPANESSSTLPATSSSALPVPSSSSLPVVSTSSLPATSSALSATSLPVTSATLPATSPSTTPETCWHTTPAPSSTTPLATTTSTRKPWVPLFIPWNSQRRISRSTTPNPPFPKLFRVAGLT